MSQRAPKVTSRATKRLMREIDARYERGEEAELDELEALLEETLESLEAALCALEEDDDPNAELEPDVDAEPEPSEGCSIEEQLVEAYERHLLSPHLFPRESLVACLNDVLMSAQRGGMTPSGFRGAEADTLVALASEMQREHREWIRLRVEKPADGARRGNASATGVA